MRPTRAALLLVTSLVPFVTARAARAQEPRGLPRADVAGGPGARPAAPSAEAADETGEPSPSRPPPKGKGVVWGVVTDTVSKEPLLDAQVTVVGTRFKAIADLDGRYRLELPPGQYEIRVWYEVHKAQRIQNVRVVAGKVAQIDVGLAPDHGAEEVVEVEAAPDRASAAAQLAIRKNAASVGDAVSAQEIAKSPDRNAADAARRVVGATVVGNKFVYVRGLGERYSNALLNGTPLPSPEPDRQAVPLDLFPALVISDITVTKSFTPDIPGDFAGGSVRITTREIPEKTTLQLTLSAGFNTESAFADRLTYQGSSMDWLGIDGGARALPEDIPPYKLVRPGTKPDGTDITRDEMIRYGRAINAYMSTRTTTNLPNLSGSAVVGDSWQVGSGQLGAMLALNYGRKFTTRSGEILRTYSHDASEPEGLHRLNDYEATTGIDQVGWGGLSTVAWRPGKDHQVSVTVLHSRSADNTAREIRGYNEERGSEITDTRLRFVSRSLTFTQLRGQHTVRPANKAFLDYNLSVSYASSDEPDTRETVYVTDATSGVSSWDDGSLSGSHFFGTQGETAFGGGLDWTQPLKSGDTPVQAKLGGLFNVKSRSFDARRFRFLPIGSDLAVFRLPPDELFTSDHIGTSLKLEENTQPNDAYEADQNLYALYLMADAHLHRRVRVIAGERLEVSNQVLDSFDPSVALDPTNPNAGRVQAELETSDLLPALGVIFKVRPDANLRLNLGKTVARPQLRELAPFNFTDYFGARESRGNPDLRRTSIYNADLRFEIFPTPGDVMAVSLFYKQFYDPIEPIIIPQGAGVTTYENAASARNIGAEIEVRKNLGFAARALADFSVFGNLTLVRSRVELDDDRGGAGEGSLVGQQTNSVRPLAGQSPFVVNAGLDYSAESTGTRARLLYNVFGARISQVGKSELPDEYEQPRHQLDATIAQKLGQHFDLKLAVENILNSATTFTQGEDESDLDITNQYKTGTTFTLSATLSN